MTDRIKFETNFSVMVNNLCNMTCSHCTGLAMYDFLGTFKWGDWNKRYKRWSEILDLRYVSICGGEPYLHPELELWFDSLREWWPEAKIEILTNGTRLSKRIELSRKIIRDGNAYLQVSCHDADTFNSMNEDLLEILEPWKDSLSNVKKEKVPLESWKMIEYYSTGRLIARLQQVTEMAPPYHKYVDNGTVYFEMGGDMVKSHESCVWKDSYTFQHGILYKCPPVTNYPEAKLQVGFEKEAREILEQYKGCDPLSDDKSVIEFINNLAVPIRVCELCAFDKQKVELGIPVTLDPSRKKKFRQFKLTQYD